MGRSNIDVTLENVSLTLEDRSVFDGLSCTLSPGRIGLIGRNGSGKSQFLRLIAGLQPASGGTLRVNGIDPAKDRKSATRDIGYVFQNPDHGLLFPTVMEELRFGAESQGWPRSDAQARALETLQEFGVEDWHDRLVESLSMGQKHLLALLAVCVTGPKLLLLDEVFAGLDLVTERLLRRALDRMPMAQIQASHDLDALAQACDRMLWIDAGKIIADDAPEQVIKHYRQAAENETDLR